MFFDFKQDILTPVVPSDDAMAGQVGQWNNLTYWRQFKNATYQFEYDDTQWYNSTRNSAVETMFGTVEAGWVISWGFNGLDEVTITVHSDKDDDFYDEVIIDIHTGRVWWMSEHQNIESVYSNLDDAIAGIKLLGVSHDA